jgi:hypothetical protein
MSVSATLVLILKTWPSPVSLDWELLHHDRHRESATTLHLRDGLRFEAEGLVQVRAHRRGRQGHGQALCMRALDAVLNEEPADAAAMEGRVDGKNGQSCGRPISNGFPLQTKN